jgi:hypothetical protein
MLSRVNLIFDKDGIYEILLGTNGIRPALRPIGLIKSENSLKARIYKGTLTLANLFRNDICSINFASPKDFWYAIKDKIPYSFYYNVPVLRHHAIAKCSVLDGDKDPAEIIIDIIDYKDLTLPNMLLRRGDYLLIDLLINFSRIDIYKGEELSRLLLIIKYEINVIQKTSPDFIPIIEEIKSEILSKGYKLN